MQPAPRVQADELAIEHSFEQVSDGPLNPVVKEPATIVVVDDELFARQMFVDLLQAQGFRVVTIARGEDVFQWLDDADLVLLDAMLPGRDGWSICREIKERDELLPVIMVTARTASDDVVRTFDAGADDYIPKPFQVAELTARIESRLRIYRAERDLKRAVQRLKELADQNYRLYEQARHDAEERTVLLREIDHRVRNNLSVITGLVGMERNRRPARPTEEALESLENRMRSFLQVYEALRRHNYRGVPVREMTEHLAQRLRNLMGRDRRVGLEISGDAFLPDERQGFALALALNELVSNAFRHAFPNGAGGCIGIEISEVNEEVRIVVTDDGVGDRRSDRPEVVGSGLSIVDALVQRELSGRVERPPVAQGTRVALSFPRSSPESR